MNDTDRLEDVPYLQLLLYVFSERQLVRRLHFRFQAGDESYNYASGDLFIGLFHEDVAAEAKQFVETHVAAMSPFLVPVSPKVGGLARDDGPAFLASLQSGIPYLPPAARVCPGDAFYIATTTPSGECRARGFPANTIQLPEPVESFLLEFEPAAERLTGASKVRTRSPRPYTARPGKIPLPEAGKPWWKFW